MDFRYVQFLNVCDQNISLRNPPRDSMHIRKMILAKPSCQIGEALLDLVQKSANIQPCPKRIYWPLNGSPNRLHEKFYQMPGGLGRFAESNSIP